MARAVVHGLFATYQLMVFGMFFFSSRPIVARLVIAMLVLFVLVYCFDVGLSAAVAQTYTPYDRPTNTTIVKVLLLIVIAFAWIAYFQSSRRVRNTWSDATD